MDEMASTLLTAPGVSSIRQRRLDRALSQQRLAELAACSLSMVRLVESGYGPTARSRVLERIEAVLDRPLDKLDDRGDRHAAEIDRETKTGAPATGAPTETGGRDAASPAVPRT